MRESLPAGTAIDEARYTRWLEEFEGYRHQITRRRIENWLDQFADSDKDVAARTLDCVEFIGSGRIDAAFRQILAALPGWNRNRAARQGEWRFVAFSTSAGESGDAMIHRFRRANNMSHPNFDQLFIHPSSLAQARLSTADTVVFIDDFTGSGDQAIGKWQNVFAEILADVPTVYLAVVAASMQVARRIREETAIQVMSDINLGQDDNIFNAACARFSAAEKTVIHAYCVRVDSVQPGGYGDCGFLVIFAHDCPNNSIPILHKVTSVWRGLFPRA